MAQATLTLMGGADPERGPVSYRGVGFREDGTRVNSVGEGTWNTVGKHKWRIRVLGSGSDGKTVLVDGELDLATSSFSGMACEWN